MAVLAEAISIVVKISSLHAKNPGGWETFKRDFPKRTLTSDGELARIGILDPRPVRELGVNHVYIEQPGITHGPVITSSQKEIYDFFGKHVKN